jgi:hypothetical protein
MLTYRIDHVTRIVEVTGTGLLTVEELTEGRGRLRADPQFDASYALLADYRLVSFSAFSSASARNVAERVPFKGPRAFVVSDIASFGALRVFEAFNELAGHSPAQVFRDMETARAWIEGVRSGQM